MKSKRRKSTAAEVAARIECIADALAGGMSKGQIRTMAKDRWGVHWKTADVYSGRAREVIIESTNRPKDQWRSESASFYEQIANDDEQETNARIRARSELDHLLGLAEPARTKIEMTAEVNSVVQHQEPILPQARVDECLVWRAQRVIAAQGEDGLQEFIAGVRRWMDAGARTRATIATTTTTKAGPVVEITSTSPGAAAPEPEAASSTWTQPVFDHGRTFDESTIAPPVAKKQRRNGAGFLSGLF